MFAGVVLMAAKHRRAGQLSLRLLQPRCTRVLHAGELATSAHLTAGLIGSAPLNAPIRAVTHVAASGSVAGHGASSGGGGGSRAHDEPSSTAANTTCPPAEARSESQISRARPHGVSNDLWSVMHAAALSLCGLALPPSQLAAPSFSEAEAEKMREAAIRTIQIIGGVVVRMQLGLPKGPVPASAPATSPEHLAEQRSTLLCYVKMLEDFCAMGGWERETVVEQIDLWYATRLRQLSAASGSGS